MDARERLEGPEDAPLDVAFATGEFIQFGGSGSNRGNIRRLAKLGITTPAQLGPRIRTASVSTSASLGGVIDRVNRAHGNGALRLASASPFTLLPCRTWHRRTENCSPRYRTRWGELPVATAAHLARHLKS